MNTSFSGATLKRHTELRVGIFILIAVLDLVVNIYNSVTTYGSVVTGILLALCEITTLYALIDIACKPIRGLTMLVISQAFTLVYEVYDGATMSEAFSDMGIMGCIAVIALIGNIAGYVKEYKLIKEPETVIKKYSRMLNYNRPLYSVKLTVRIIIYSLFIVAVNSLANSEILSTISNDILFRTYSSAVIVVPTFLLLGMTVTSYLAYEFFILKLFIEVYTLLSLEMINEFKPIQLLYIVVEVIAIVYAYYVSFKENNKKEGKHGK